MADFATLLSQKKKPAPRQDEEPFQQQQQQQQQQQPQQQQQRQKQQQPQLHPPPPPQQQQQQQPTRTKHFSLHGRIDVGGPESHSSLVSLCRAVIVSNLERFPPEAFAILDEQEWESIIEIRHDKTKPQKGKGGIDGRGRIAPAVSDKYLSQVERSIPHLAESAKVDQLVWKDCVEHKFKAGGLTRPRGLKYPWPVLVDNLTKAGEVLASAAKKKAIEEEDNEDIAKAITTITETPVNVSLLKATSIGKNLKKFLKGCSDDLENDQKTRLQTLLESWMAVAANSGVDMQQHEAANNNIDDTSTFDKDLRRAEKCQSWRDLFKTLSDREEKRRSNQGAKMRESRRRLDSTRPKIVKVRPTSAKHTGMLARSQQRGSSAPWGGSAKPTFGGTSKMQQLKQETFVSATRQRSAGIPPKSHAAKGKGDFGAAVAFASTSGKLAKRKVTTTTVSMGKGKRLRMPNHPTSGSSLQKGMNLSKKPNSGSRR